MFRFFPFVLDIRSVQISAFCWLNDLIAQATPFRRECIVVTARLVMVVRMDPGTKQLHYLSHLRPLAFYRGLSESMYQCDERDFMDWPCKSSGQVPAAKVTCGRAAGHLYQRCADSCRRLPRIFCMPQARLQRRDPNVSSLPSSARYLELRRAAAWLKRSSFRATCVLKAVSGEVLGKSLSQWLTPGTSGDLPRLPGGQSRTLATTCAKYKANPSFSKETFFRIITLRQNMCNLRWI